MINRNIVTLLSKSSNASEPLQQLMVIALLLGNWLTLGGTTTVA